MYFKKKLEKLSKKSFLRNVIILMTGTAFAQALLILSTPILTRLYSPEDFGVYGNFTAITAILTIVISLRYELAIVLPKSTKEAKSLVTLSVLIAAGISLLLFLLIFLFGEKLTNNFDWIDNDYLYLIPIYVFIVGVFQILTYWYTRIKNFKKLAIAHSGRSLLTVGVQLLSGFFLLLGAYGLIIGQLFGQIFAVVFLFYYLKKKKKFKGISSNIRELIKLAKKYKDFPLYSSLNSFVNTISVQIPVLIITFYFSASVAGLYMLGHRLVSMPMTLISRSISQVFLQKLAFDKADQKSNKSTYRLWKYLSPLSIVINIVVIIFAPWAFGLIFGEEWFIAGEYARWISLWTVFQFIASPLSSISYTYNKQRFFLVLQIFLLIIRVTVLVVGGILNSPILAIALFAVVSGLYNLITTSMYIFIESGKREAIISAVANLITFAILLLIIILF